MQQGHVLRCCRIQILTFMAETSKRINGIAASPIRKLAPLAEKAKARGVKVYHLNIGQPDIRTPEVAIEALRRIDRTVLEYSPSQGFLSLREKIAVYYSRYGMDYSPDQIIVTSGGSEAVLFSFLACMDPGDEIITTDPTYANYIAFAAAAGVKVKTILTRIEDNFALPPVEEFETLITPATKAILICNPNNPTGSLYTAAEMQMLAEIVRRHDLFLFSDEVYREFIYGDAEYVSAGHLEGVDDNVVILDSFSKRYSECGIRIGAVVTRNRSVAEGVLKLGQARLSPPLLGQIVAEASCSVGREYLDPVINEYGHRRNVLVDGLKSIPGVVVSVPSGAFYVIARLPVDDADRFCAWCLESFEYEGETVMMAPASGFYFTPGAGRSEVRIAYVLEAKCLERAVVLLSKALEKYRSQI